VSGKYLEIRHDRLQSILIHCSNIRNIVPDLGYFEILGQFNKSSLITQWIKQLLVTCLTKN
jgi:hypothetical protein